jgi:hypothetical protein
MIQKEELVIDVGITTVRSSVSYLLEIFHDETTTLVIRVNLLALHDVVELEINIGKI